MKALTNAPGSGQVRAVTHSIAPMKAWDAMAWPARISSSSLATMFVPSPESFRRILAVAA